MTTGTTASVSTHILDTSAGRPARGVPVRLFARPGPEAGWRALGGSTTDADGRCRDLPDLPEGTAQARLDFAVERYLENSPHSAHTAEEHTAKEHTAEERADAQQHAPAGRHTPAGRKGGTRAFFPEVTVTFAVVPGEHYHVPLLLNPFGYSVYRGS
ncbi:hydroxyisourate hydrolase [Streptomyces sp. NPDC003374]